MLRESPAFQDMAREGFERGLQQRRTDELKTLRRVGNSSGCGTLRCVWETDAQAARAREKKGKPWWLDLSHEGMAHARHSVSEPLRECDSLAGYFVLRGASSLMFACKLRALVSIMARLAHICPDRNKVLLGYGSFELCQDARFPTVVP
jgi:hypothetical protein